MIYYRTVLVNQKCVAVARVTRRQNLNQSVDIKIYRKNPQKISVLAVNNLGERHAIIPRAVVNVRRRYRKAVMNIGGIFGFNIPRAQLNMPSRIRRLPTVIHYDLMTFMRISQIASGNIGVFLNNAVEKFHGVGIIIHKFGVLGNHIG